MPRSALPESSPSAPNGRRPFRRPSGLLSLIGIAALVVACGSSANGRPARGGSSGSTSTAIATDTAAATLGDLHISGAYIPQPASPDVAAAYFTVTNTGSSPDTLTGATTPDAASVMAHDTVADGGGAEEMVPLGTSTIAAHGTLAFSVGHKHLMLMNPVAGIHQGEHVPLTLDFARAGKVTLQVPVTSLTGPTGDTGSGASMPDMPGMNMGSASP